MSAVKQALRALRFGGTLANPTSRVDARSTSPDGDCCPQTGPARTESAGSIEPERLMGQAPQQRVIQER